METMPSVTINIQVEIDARSRAALRALGWRPPSDDTGRYCVAPECLRGDHGGCWDDVGKGGHPCDCCALGHQLTTSVLAP